jgi:DNA-binding MarR family transcriptional regulator
MDGPTGTPIGTEEPDVLELAARLRLTIARLARLLRQQAATGLTPSQISVLVSLDLNQSLTLGELAAIEQVAPPTITKIVAKLEDDGLVARHPVPGDRRVARVSVTDEGRRRLDHSRDRRNAWLAVRLDELGPADTRRLADALDALEALAGGAPPPPAPPVPLAGDTPGAGRVPS